MEEQELDFTLTFRHLRDAPTDEEAFVRLFPRPESARDWLSEWRATLARLGIGTEDAAAGMRAANPVVIPRNHRIEAVIAAARARDFAPFHELHQVLQSPWEETAGSAAYETPPAPHELVRATFCGT
jgi:uncharacterized protein YdiU (UPF0061 family)